MNHGFHHTLARVACSLAQPLGLRVQAHLQIHYISTTAQRKISKLHGQMQADRVHMVSNSKSAPACFGRSRRTPGNACHGLMPAALSGAGK